MEKKIFATAVCGTIKAPTSKSYAQRALAIAALSDGESVLRNMDSCNDIEAAMSVVRKLGAEVSMSGSDCSVLGRGLHVHHNELSIGESGLSTRLFTPIAALSSEKITITGHGSILKRPISSMEQPLVDLGVEFNSNKGFLPLSVKGPMRGGEVDVDGSLSSQFLSGLLVALPMAKEDSMVNVKSLASRPYIDMTIDTMQAFGVRVDNFDYERFSIKGGQSYRPHCYNVEGDWSGASCLLVAGAIMGSVAITNLDVRSPQADRAILEALTLAGATIYYEWGRVIVENNELSSFEFDATHCPDLFPALVALAAACEGVSSIVGTNRLIHKESNRALALKEIYAKFGIHIDLRHDNVMLVTGSEEIKDHVVVDSFNDHRMAMSAAVTALRCDTAATIKGAEAVNKSYPNFWRDLEILQVKENEEEE